MDLHITCTHYDKDFSHNDMSHTKLALIHTDFEKADLPEENAGPQENGATGKEVENEGSQDVNSQETVSDSSVEKVNAIASQFLARRGGGDAGKKATATGQGKPPTKRQPSRRGGRAGGRNVPPTEVPGVVQADRVVDRILKIVKKSNNRGLRVEHSIKMVKTQVDDIAETLESFRDAILRKINHDYLPS